MTYILKDGDWYLMDNGSYASMAKYVPEPKIVKLNAR